VCQYKRCNHVALISFDSPSVKVKPSKQAARDESEALELSRSSRPHQKHCPLGTSLGAVLHTNRSLPDTSVPDAVLSLAAARRKYPLHAAMLFSVSD
jgi:hypothetical protein